MNHEPIASPTDGSSLPVVPTEVAAVPLESEQRPADRESPADSASRHRAVQLPSLARQAWNLAQSLADFVADGCHLVTADQYRQRLEICDTCDHRRDNRCLKCGCRLSLKARGRAFQCPAKKWPEVPVRL